MIQLINKIIIDKIPHLVGKEEKLSFLKYSTHAASQSKNAKIIIFVFKEGAKTPSFVVKTVRSYERRETIERNYNDLRMLNKLVEGSLYKKIFPKALILHDDGENIFSIETACLGSRPDLTPEVLDDVVTQYANFGQYLSEKTDSSLVDLDVFTQEMISKSQLNEGNKLQIRTFFSKLPMSDMKLPRLIQHGDVTRDNLLLSEMGICIIDCDTVGLIDLPGLDLFSLFYRYDPYQTKSLCKKYLPDYFSKIGASVKNDEYDRFYFLCFFIERIIKKPYLVKTLSAERIISDFNKYFSN